MRYFFVLVYVYGSAGVGTWTLFSFPLLLVGWHAALAGPTYQLPVASTIAVGLQLASVVCAIGLGVGLIIALCLDIGGRFGRQGIHGVYLIVAQGGPRAISLLAGVLQGYLLIPAYGPGAWIACGVILMFLYPRSLIRVAAPWRQRLTAWTRSGTRCRAR